MTVVVGLGNPGSKYEHTRHNVGFDAVQKAAAFFQVKLKKRCFRLYRQAVIKTEGGNKAALVQPLTFMNASGNIVDSFPKDSRFIVVCDNMDLGLGGLRIRQGGGTAGQKGLASIAEKLGTADFVRIYIGIGRPQPGVSVIDHVLGRETEEKRREVLQKAIDDAAKAIVGFVNGSSVGDMQLEYNRKGIL